MNSKHFGILSLFLTVTLSDSCRKLISIPEPVGTVVASAVFSNDQEATSAAAGMYFNMINTNRTFSNSGISVFCGMSADELISFDQNYYDLYVQFQKNELVSTNGYIGGNFWANAYSVIYQANALIEGLQNYSGVHDSVKNELIGEAEFVRAFCNFYLTNLFGDIPLVTTIKYQQTSLLSRTPAGQVYQAIVQDLKDAKNRMASDYSVGSGQRIVPNRWAAMALLARVYLYTNDWQDAALEADSVIKNSGLYTLVPDLTQVFLTNSKEAIWQLQQNNSISNAYNVTPEGFLLIPSSINSDLNPPFAYLTNTQLNTFEPGDQRRTKWVDSTIYRNALYYFPFKYKQGPIDATPNGNYLEYYMVLRLAEQYLLRAEAEVQMSEESAALNDLNLIRNRAGLTNYTGSTNKDSLLNAIYHERQVELFVEWGHRWLDLKRTGQASSVLSANKGMLVTNNMLLYPIPVGELRTDPNLSQNPGY
jgi:starch-binding outer membrane protein, SusD/RagB family